VSSFFKTFSNNNIKKSTSICNIPTIEPGGMKPDNTAPSHDECRKKIHNRNNMEHLPRRPVLKGMKGNEVLLNVKKTPVYL